MNTDLLGAVISAIAGVVTAVIAAIAQVRAARLNAKNKIIEEYRKKERELPSDEEIERQIKEKARPTPIVTVRASLISGILVIVLVLGFTLGLWPILAQKTPTSPEALIYDFESSDLDPDWVILNGKADLSRDSAQAFSGRHSLCVDVTLTQQQAITDPAGTVQLDLRGRDIRDKIAIYRIYVPEQAPSNLRSGLYILDNDDQWLDGPFIEHLPGGKWSTLVWSTQDAAEWEPPATLGIQFSLLPTVGASDRPMYEGPIYIDLVEILDLPDVYAERTGLDSLLEPLPFHFYDFEQATEVPGNITSRGETRDITVADKEARPDGEHSLKLDLDLKPYDSSAETGWGGIYVDLGGVKRVEAMSFSILIPDQPESLGGDFGAFFVAVDDEGRSAYSGSRPVPVGKWSPQFWGTRYAYNGPVLCPDEDEDGQCDDPAKQWWYGWYETDIKGFYIRIIRSGESYRGPAYIDDLAVYQLRP